MKVRKSVGLLLLGILAIPVLVACSSGASGGKVDAPVFGASARAHKEAKEAGGK